ncbi:hypothetical protein ACGF0J_30070 [Nonomuraea sp. NPDC047897]|uniref:hypothetical protein n=1 Tax=Nonomuraea sp. NPDC047897 TaxID=3364346 RepID=UPI0037173F31
MIRLLRLAALLVLAGAASAALLVSAGAAPAAAHNLTAGTDLRIAQTIAGTELTVIVKGTARVPGPLEIGVMAFQPVAELPLNLEVRSVEDGRTVSGVARAARDPRYVRLQVERTGPHELRLSAGSEVAVVPFRVLVDRGSGWDFLIYGGLFVAGLLLVGGLLTGALSRRTPAMLLAGGAAAGLTIAALVVVLEPRLPTGPPDGAPPSAEPQAGEPQPGGRPFVQGRLETVPEHPSAGEEFTVRVALVDGSTGRPVDDLTVHHEALAHLVVTSEDGRFFRHLHPLRTAPGLLEVRMRADRPGRYLAHAEVEREDSGGQLVTESFDVGGRPAEPETPAPPATPLLRPATPVAGRPTTIELGTAGPPRPWLGMTGHLIVRSRDGTFLGHVHEMGSSGPRLRFTFSFPEPGRYLAWAQYAANDRIVTMPFTVDVTEPEAGR